MLGLSNYGSGNVVLVTAGGADAVVRAMRAHVGVAEVQEHGCLAVWNLTATGDGSGGAALVAAGGAEAVAGAMRAHVGVAEVQEAGLGAAFNLATNEGCAALRRAGVEQLARDAASNHPVRCAGVAQDLLDDLT
eukprot:COSAG01_NODE_7633_length_3120_cov_6.410460_3_plen_134_part_00